MTVSGFQNILRSRSFRYLVILLATAAVYWTTLSSGFVQWDDSLLTENLALRGFSPDHLRAVLLPKGGAYQPVRNLAFSLTYQFSKLEPFGYHLVNFVLYLLVVVLAFRVLEVLADHSPGKQKVKNYAPWIGAALFAFHPLHVEGVAWIQGNKDLLVSLFFLFAFLSYEKYASTGRSLKYYWLSYLLFLLALGSKPTAVAFPLVLLAYDLILNPAAVRNKGGESRPVAAALLIRYLPYLIPAALLSVYFIFFTGAMEQNKLTLENILVIPEILWNYYRLIFLPVGLLHRYLDPSFQGFTDLEFLAGSVATAAILYFAFRKARKFPVISFGIFWFYICWLPQSNLVPIEIRVADRYIFISLLGVCLVAAVLLSELLESAAARWKTVLRVMIVALCMALAFLSYDRCRIWRNGESLWLDAVSKIPGAGFYQRGLAEAYLAKDELEFAFRAFEKASVINPYDVRALTNMGYIRKKQGRMEEAERLYQRAISVDNTNYNAFNSLANIYTQQGEDSLAIQYYRRAIDLRPGSYLALYNLSVLFRKLGRTEEADSLLQELEKASLPRPIILLKRGMDLISDGMLDSAKIRFKRALVLDADLTQAYAQLGEVYLRQDSLDLALTHLRRALADAVPEWSLYNNLGLAFSRSDIPDSALYYYRKAYELEPDSAVTTLDLAVLLNRKGETEEAIGLVERLLEKDPDNFLAHYNLGNWLTNIQLYPEAAAHYLQALTLDPDNANAHLNLGLLYIKYLNRPGPALEHLERALILEPGHPQAHSIRQTVDFLKSRLN